MRNCALGPPKVTILIVGDYIYTATATTNRASVLTIIGSQGGQDWRQEPICGHTSASWYQCH
eukprot:1536368-Amphidinium_carterae.1